MVIGGYKVRDLLDLVVELSVYQEKGRNYGLHIPGVCAIKPISSALLSDRGSWRFWWRANVRNKDLLENLARDSRQAHDFAVISGLSYE